MRYRMRLGEPRPPSAPAMTDESASPSLAAPTLAAGGQPAPAPRSQRPDRGAGFGCPEREAKEESNQNEAGAEGRGSLGSGKGRLTARDRELLGHLGLVRYLRTGQMA